MDVFNLHGDDWDRTEDRPDSPVRVLMLSTLLMPEIVKYLDTGKVGTRDARGERLPPARRGPAVEYWEGES